MSFMPNLDVARGKVQRRNGSECIAGSLMLIAEISSVPYLTLKMQSNVFEKFPDDILLVPTRQRVKNLK